MFDFFAFAVCLWAAAYHTPPGALIRGAIAKVTDTRSSARPLLAYYSGGVYESQTIETPTELLDLPQPGLLAAIPQGPAIGRGVYASLRKGTPDQRKTANALATRYKLDLSMLDDPGRGPELCATLIGRAQADLGSEDAAVLAVFAGYEAADFAAQRARSENRPLELQVLAQQLPPSERGAVDSASQALTLGTAYALSWPVPSRTRVSSPFGYRHHPTLGRQQLHTLVHATAGGTVRRASEDGVNGRVVIIDHGRGVSTAYCHNSKLRVTTGQLIKAGDVISESGNTGRSTGPHLHYQLELAHQAMDPFLFKSAHSVEALVFSPRPPPPPIPVVPVGSKKPNPKLVNALKASGRDPTVVVDGGVHESDRQSPPNATEF
jgi:murein DD-endopeptidase